MQRHVSVADIQGVPWVPWNTPFEGLLSHILSKSAQHYSPHQRHTETTLKLNSTQHVNSRVTDWEKDDIVEPLEKVIQSCFIPALTGQPPPGAYLGDVCTTGTAWWGSAPEQQAASSRSVPHLST